MAVRPTYDSVVEATAYCLVEFLEAAVHSILKSRQVYPSEIFERRCKYGIPVWMSRHPDLNTYISEAVYGCIYWLKNGEMEQFTVAILNLESMPVEKFVFRCVLSPSERSLCLDVEAELRSFLLKISVSDSVLKPNPSGCSFSLGVHTVNQVPQFLPHQNSVGMLTKSRQATENENTAEPVWLPGMESFDSRDNFHLIPLKVLDSGSMQLSLYVEETTHKGSL